MAKYIADAKQRITENLRKYTKIIEQAKNRGVNEADTRDIVKAILGDVLGYDPFFEVTGEYSVKGQYADFGVKFGDEIGFFVEVKSVARSSKRSKCSRSSAMRRIRVTTGRSSPTGTIGSCTSSFRVPKEVRS